MTRRRRSLAVALGALLVAIAGAAGPLAPAASAGTVPTFDLSVATSAHPVDVQAGGQVRFRSLVTNNGPATAPAVGFVDTIPQFTTFVSSAASVGGCSGAGADRRVVCLFGTLAPGASVTIDVVVVAPDAIGARLVNTATVVSNPVDSDVSNNVRTAVTTVQPPLREVFTGFVAPGSSLSTGDAAAGDDPTISRLHLPRVGQGATVTLVETRNVRFCGGQRCAGQAVTLKNFPGYNDPDRLPVLRIHWDETLDRSVATSVVWMKRGTTVSVLSPCNADRDAPCILTKRKLSVRTTKNPDSLGDLEVRILVPSAEARFAIR
jgi:uncharacterized repeat protein (TIGR01451 family)